MILTEDEKLINWEVAKCPWLDYSYMKQKYQCKKSGKMGDEAWEVCCGCPRVEDFIEANLSKFIDIWKGV